METQLSFMLLLLDLSAAFDTVDHTIFVSRMSSKIGIKGDALNWFRAYLSDCIQAVHNYGAISDSHDVVRGVLQGTVLGPILYLIPLETFYDLTA